MAKDKQQQQEKAKKHKKAKVAAKAIHADVCALQEKLFVLLDKAQLAPATILNGEKHKEHYETLAMFAFRKLQAANYHAARVDALYEAYHAEARRFLKRAKKPQGDLKITSVSTRYYRSANEFVHELSAFFGAIRSALDFLARLSIQHTKQMKEIDSISKFLTMAEQGRSGTTVEVVAKHADWLTHLRDYRDYLVHHLTITTPIGAGRMWKFGKWKSHSVPVVVPAESPQFVPDTRLRRAMEEDPPGLSTATMEMLTTAPDGGLIDGKHSIEYIPAEGYERIEVLMKRELENFEAFHADVLRTLIALNFAPVAIGPKKKSGSKAVD